MADHWHDEAWREVSYRRNRKRRHDYSPPALPRYERSTDRYNHRNMRYQPNYGSATRANHRDSWRREDAHYGSERRERDPPRRRFDRRNRTSGNRRPQRYGTMSTRTQKERNMSGQRSTDPDFSVKTRVLYRLIKATHHLSNVTASQPPASIARMTANLSTAIKPAAPTPTTLSLIEGNARYWAQNTTIILRDHYEDSIKNDVQILTQLGGEMKQNFDIASAWARRHFGLRLKQITLDNIWTKLRRELVEGSTEPTGSFHTSQRPTMSNNSSRPMPMGRNPAAVQIPDEITSLPTPPEQAPRRTYSQVVAGHTSILRTPPTPIRRSPENLSPATTTGRHRTTSAQVPDQPRKPQLVTTGTMTTQQGGDWSPDLPAPQLQSGEERSAGTFRPITPPFTWHSRASPFLSTPPQPQGPIEEEWLVNPTPENQPPATVSGRRLTISAQVHGPPRTPPLFTETTFSTQQRADRSPVIPRIQLLPKERRVTRSFKPATLPSARDPQQPLLPSTSTPGPAGEMESEPLIDLTGGEEPALNLPKSSGGIVTTPSVGQLSGGRTQPTSKLITDLVQSQLQFDQPRATTAQDTTQIPIRRPTRHVNTKKKMVDWSLRARSKWLIMGDSNLARFPPFQHQDLQVDSFPGATFRHAEAILARVDVSPEVQKVILSFGLNNRAQKTEQTTIKQLQRAVRMAKLAFPQAQIMIPEINFSRALPHQEQDNLRELNKYINKHQCAIPELARKQFVTEKDKLHWSHATAKTILSHWLEYLKEGSP